MSIETVQSLTDILEVVQDARVRALRWDIVPSALVLDLDCALETTQKGEVRMAHVCRGWLVVENAHNLQVHIDWNEFRGGFSLVDIQERQAEDAVGRRDYSLDTDFPAGVFNVSGRRLLLLRSMNTLEVRGLEIPTDKRHSLATDIELTVAYSCGKDTPELL